MCVCVCVCVFAPPSVLDRNGVIVTYIVSYGKEGAGPDDVKERGFPSTGEDPQRITLTGLDPDSTYLSLLVLSSSGYSRRCWDCKFSKKFHGCRSR